MLLLLGARGPLGVWDATREVGTALREKKKKDVAGPVRHTSAFLLSTVELSLNCHEF